ncbi:MAG: YggS family pyridoxal phosphate-dependent enzyme [Ferruginibacter sp.]
MAFITTRYNELKLELAEKQVDLVAVSKTKPLEDLLEAYEEGQKDFGENYVQELLEKASAMPADTRWHFIGHLQTNKVKQIAPVVYLVHGVDSEKLLSELNKQAAKLNKNINCLLQVHIAEEETKFGFSMEEVTAVNISSYPNLTICGLMGMASFTNDKEQVQKEFRSLDKLYKEMQRKYPAFKTLSMGMSGDYKIAVAEGSTMVRIGSMLFGERK